MGARGPAPTPTALKLVRGTARRDRMNPAEPMPGALEVGSVPPPWLMGVRRRRAWVELAELLGDQHVLTAMDAAALALLVDAYGDYLEASDLIHGLACAHCGQSLRSRAGCSRPRLVGEEELERIPHTPGRRYYATKTETGSLMVRPHPALGEREKAWARVVSLLKEFGMTPAQRTRISQVAPEEHDPMADLLGVEA